MMGPPRYCDAVHCGQTVYHNKLLCDKHWAMVPKKLKDLLIFRFRPGQAIRDVKPEWDAVVVETLKAVAKADKALRDAEHKKKVEERGQKHDAKNWLTEDEDRD